MCTPYNYSSKQPLVAERERSLSLLRIRNISRIDNEYISVMNCFSTVKTMNMTSRIFGIKPFEWEARREHRNHTRGNGSLPIDMWVLLSLFQLIQKVHTVVN